MMGTFLGPGYSDKDIFKVIRQHEASYDYFKEFSELTAFISRQLAEGKVVGWFQDRMEFGPRALGNRSILGDPRNPEMQRKLNIKIKAREGFRPFAPSVLIEDAPAWFKINGPSPYMLLVASLRDELRNAEPPGYPGLGLYERLYHVRSAVPAITHVDYSARIQTVCPDMHPKFYQLINDFKKITGCGMLINTSFNVRGEPMVCSPQDAYRGFMRTGMDYLVMGNFVLDRSKQGNALPDEKTVLQIIPD
jgi:carbamoyltransferase